MLQESTMASISAVELIQSELAMMLLECSVVTGKRRKRHEC